MQISGKGHPTRPSSPTLVLLAFLRLILLSRSGDSPLYCFSNKSLSGSYALRLSPSPYRPPPSKFQIYSSIAFSPPPSPHTSSSSLAKTGKLKASRASSVSYQSSSAFTGGAITLFLVPFDRSFRSLEYIPPRDFFHQHSFTPVRYTYNEEVHRDRTRVGATERLSFLSASP